MTPTDAYRKFLREVRKTPVSDGFRYIHQHLKSLTAKAYFDPTEPWVQADQLAAVAKFLFLFGSKRIKKRSITISNLFNRYKDFWSAAEQENPYTKDRELLALFVLRFVYQQYPFRVFANRVPRMFQRTRNLYVDMAAGLRPTAVKPAEEFERLSGIPLEPFLRIAEKLYPAFKQFISWDPKSLADRLEVPDAALLVPVLKVVSAGQGEFSELHEQTKADSLIETPYDFNPFLRYPIVRFAGQFWAPFPELIPYAATRGLFFYLSDNLKERFNQAFGDLFASYAVQLTVAKLGKAVVLTEEDERKLGWEGKTNDFTVLIGEEAILFECKTSALFLSAKRHASLEEVRQDLKKNLVSSKAKKGLFQLFEKIEAIKSRKLPLELNRRYEQVKKFYPVVLLYDQIQFANQPETLRNALETELRSAGIAGFRYQVWHMEELENLYELLPPEDFAAIVTKKFEDERYFRWDLNTLLYEETEKQHRYLCPFMFIPKGDTLALRTLQSLRDPQ